MRYMKQNRKKKLSKISLVLIICKTLNYSQAEAIDSNIQRLIYIFYSLSLRLAFSLCVPDSRQDFKQYQVMIKRDYILWETQVTITPSSSIFEALL